MLLARTGKLLGRAERLISVWLVVSFRCPSDALLHALLNGLSRLSLSDHLQGSCSHGQAHWGGGIVRMQHNFEHWRFMHHRRIRVLPMSKCQTRLAFVLTLHRKDCFLICGYVCISFWMLVEVLCSSWGYWADLVLDQSAHTTQMPPTFKGTQSKDPGTLTVKPGLGSNDAIVFA